MFKLIDNNAVVSIKLNPTIANNVYFFNKQINMFIETYYFTYLMTELSKSISFE